MIELRNIHKTYRMGTVEVKALQDVSLTIQPGEFVAIMGASGSGKSTLMHVLGLLDRPDAGMYEFCGESVMRFSDERLAAIRNRLAGFIFQQFHLLPRMNVRENVSLPLVYAARKDTVGPAVQRIQEVGLSDRISHRSNELSGGQQQRVAIARALVNEPLLILADEPTGNLDSRSKDDIMALLDDLHHRGKTVIVVTHEPEVAAHARRIITMRDGRIISDKKNIARQVDTKTDAAATDWACAIVRDATHKVGKVEFSEFLRQAVYSIFSHRMRSFLSILGILIGVAAVIAMLALGQGAKQSIEARLSSLGSNLLVIRPGSAKVHGVSQESGTVTRFTMKDIASLSRIPDVKSVSPSVMGRGQLVYGNKNWNTQIEGVGVEYETLRNVRPYYGRFFTPEEVLSREKVALLGLTVVRELFGEENPVGQTIKINLINFKVIGVLPTKGASSFHDQDDTLILPVTTAMYRLLGKQYLDTIYVEVRDPALVEQAIEAVEQTIKRLHRLGKDDDDTFSIRNMSDIREALESTTKTMSGLLGAIAVISLLVGGIGIMNIMLVSVTERTREIGLRKAIGATNRDIMLQFLVEAMLMSFLGGVFGILLGSGAALLMSVIAKWTVRVSLSSILLATVFSIGVGIVFGLWPARQASRLNPIEALRYE